MKIKAKIDCTGVGYENFKAGETRNVKKEIAEKLLKFRYAEKVNTSQKR